MTLLQTAATVWLETAEQRLAHGGITKEDLAALRRVLNAAAVRQRLLYLHTRDPSIYSNVIGMALHEPIAGKRDAMRSQVEWPYTTVHDAVVAGWQVIQFPNQLAPYDDREMDYLGYEFILQKLEVMVDESE